MFDERGLGRGNGLPLVDLVREGFLALQRAAKQFRKIEARSVYGRSIYDRPADVAAIRAFIDAGEQARVVDELPIKLVLIDERVALFTLDDPIAGPPEVTIMIVEHPSLAQLLKIAFEAVWEAGSAFVEDPGG